jgi:hypothetical protein
MTSTDQSAAAAEPLGRAWLRVAGYYLSRRRTLIVLAIGLATAGIALNWSWLVAAGIAPVLITLLPCAAMCGLGLCMRGMGGHSSCSKQETSEGSVPSNLASTEVASAAADAPRPEVGASEARSEHERV